MCFHAAIKISIHISTYFQKEAVIQATDLETLTMI